MGSMDIVIYVVAQGKLPNETRMVDGGLEQEREAGDAPIELLHVGGISGLMHTDEVTAYQVIEMHSWK